MGAITGGARNIVTNGLVLNLDAANYKSYPGNGTVWTDLTGNNNNGTLTNGPTYSSTNAGSISFDGTNDYVIISSSINITPRTGDFTNDFWINPTSWAIGTYDPIQVTALTNGLWIGQNASSQFIVRAYGVADRLQYSTLPTTGSWTNISVTRNSNLISLYYNGVFMTSSISSQDFLQGTTYIGSDGPVSGGAVFFNGKISSVRYYNRSLPASEILQNFNSTRARFGI